MHTGFGGGRAAHDLGYERTVHLRKAERAGDVRGERVDVDPQHAALDRAEFQELVGHVLDHVYGDREADADIAAAL